jgi:hypothetical protein
VTAAFSRSLAGAVLLHAAFVAAVWRAPARVVIAPVEAPPTELEVRVLEASELPPREAQPSEPNSARSTTQATQGNPEARRAITTTTTVPEPAISGALPEIPSPLSSAAPETAGDREGRARGAIAGLFGGKLAPSFQAPAPESSVAPALPEVSKDRAGEVVRELLDAHDRVIGVGFGGPVATAAHQAALGGSAPQTGNVTLEARTDESGSVISVRILSGSPSTDSWASVAGLTFASLRSQKLRVGGRGASVVVRVEAKMQLPSGANGKIERKGVGAQFDLSDIGAVSLRNVSSRVVSERRD